MPKSHFPNVTYESQPIRLSAQPEVNAPPSYWYVGGSGKYAMLPALALSDIRLTYEQLRVLIALLKYTNTENRTCYPDRNKLAVATRIHPVNISKATSALERAGWLKKVRRGHGLSALYTMALPNTAVSSEGNDHGDNVSRTPPFAYVPIDILLDRKVTFEALRVFIALALHANKEDGTCFPGRAKVSKRARLHPNNVSAATRILVKAGWLRKTLRHHRSSIYKLTVPDLRLIHGLSDPTA